ncbi:MAG: VIT1/CCC1 family protein [Geobacteraceae bacterium]|nr:VIT1/CCC1 family protein [Geobacteraceae bacterium]
MASRQDIRRFRANLLDEMNSAALYRDLAANEKNEELAEVYQRLADTEQDHADTWAKRLEAVGAKIPTFRPSWRTRTLAMLARQFGVDMVLPTLATIERNATSGYDSQPDAADMVDVERSHARLLTRLDASVRGGRGGAAVAQIEGRHRTAGGNALRAAVLGASDGLLSNFNLVMGVAGAALSGTTILLTGLAGLLAGAISMAMGEWISVQSSRELYLEQIEREKEEIAADPEEELEELVLIYRARGLSEAEARALATRLMSDPETALETLARDELGIDPDELGGSAWEAAITSFLLFAAGAVLPVIPYFFLSGGTALAVSAGLSTAGLFFIGAAITLFTGRPVLYSGARQVLFGLVAAGVTFSVGKLIGVAIVG